MVSKGRDVSALFPDVVKNVVCQNLEVKKLVYVYLTHYAEIEPEPALLAINTFQKDLKDQNPLIRAQVRSPYGCELIQRAHASGAPCPLFHSSEGDRPNYHPSDQEMHN